MSPSAQLEQERRTNHSPPKDIWGGIVLAPSDSAKRMRDCKRRTGRSLLLKNLDPLSVSAVPIGEEEEEEDVGESPKRKSPRKLLCGCNELRRAEQSATGPGY